ncbi:MAG: metallophosphoesterase, partial [Steroidobacteraceae bacterium]|nr:metallophosphoesterase [Steroidobacteraceae bacterium]
MSDLRSPRAGWMRCAAAVCALGALTLAATSTRAAESQVQWAAVERVVAFADVHGAYEELTTLLRSAGVVDPALRWSGGGTHLVSLGDLLDRGADSRKVMDLLMRLQGEAEAAGGRVHVVLGNHEAMNVLGDLRYVDPGEYAAYAAEEDAAERAQAKGAFLARQPGATEADFERLFPTGYFGHRSQLGPDGRYGQWLLSLPVAVKINDTVYMHGGPSKVLR